MNDFFYSLYSWLYKIFPLYGESLHLYLGGDGQVADSTVYYNRVGLITLIVSLGFAIIYFYVINHTKSNWLTWLLTLLINSVICLVFSWLFALSHLLNGNIPAEILYDNSVTMISRLDCFFFGGATFFVAAFFFSAISLLINWWSSNAKFIFRKKN